MQTAITTTLIACLLFVTPAWADDSHDHDRARQAVQAGEILPLRTILDHVARDFPGDVIEAELEDEHGRPTYEIKLISPQGQVMKIVYDACDGSILKVKGKHR